MTDQSRTSDWMQTFTGRKFWPLDPRPEDVHVEDVAHHLAMICRYNGGCLKFYSVAEHSVLLARHVMEKFPHLQVDPTLRNSLSMWMLMHDASEAYLGDVIRPIKPHLAGYREVDDKVQWAVYERFGLDPADEPKFVKVLDARILKDEREQNMHPTDDTWKYLEGQTEGQTEALGVTLQLWSPEQAEYEFLRTFDELTGHRPT